MMMTGVEQKILIGLLKQTRGGPAEPSAVAQSVMVPADVAEAALERLAARNLVRWEGQLLEVSPEQRVGIAITAIRSGADLERVCRLLEWKEFEEISVRAFEAHNFDVRANYQFKDARQKRWQIDVLAFKQPTIASVDCKLWQQGWTRSPIQKVVEAHVGRTHAFAESLPKLPIKKKLERWKKVVVVPLILSLLPSPFKFYDNTPIVPILKLQDFIYELPAHVHTFTHF
ncbi:MAG: hypothetical protein NWE82_00010 [Candidatus Bathyarchaeota archaeon]|nr:hypothetical protein [Candidatus Bathyarchaeota archaeon]